MGDAFDVIVGVSADNAARCFRSSAANNPEALTCDQVAVLIAPVDVSLVPPVETNRVGGRRILHSEGVWTPSGSAPCVVGLGVELLSDVISELCRRRIENERFGHVCLNPALQELEP